MSARMPASADGHTMRGPPYGDLTTGRAAPRRRPGRQGRVAPSALGGAAVAFVVVVGMLTVAAQAHAFVPDRLAASYERVIGHGELWTLFTSATVADDPVWISLASFAAIAVVALLVCGGQLFWLTVVAAHVGSAATIYLFMAVSRALDGGLFAASLLRPDVGVSTMQGGLLGASAFVLWRASGGSRARRALVVAGVCVVAVVAWRIHPDPSVLTYEHHVAFLIGILVARLVLGGTEPRRAAAPRSA